MTDRYESVSVHGLMPLVVDRDTGALRFAVLESDAPEDCVRVPSELPEALVQIFSFDSVSHASVWAEGIREVATNAIAVEFPALRSPTFALLVRHDREPLRGSTLEECVALRQMRHTRHDRDPVAEAAGDRRREIERAHSAQAEAAYRRDWAREIAEIEATQCGHVAIESADVASGKPLAFQVRGPDGFVGTGPKFRVTPDREAYAVSWFPTRRMLSPELAAGLESQAERLGLRFRDGELSRSLDALDDAMLLDLRRVQGIFERHSLAAANLQQAQESVARLLANERMMSLLRRVRDGFPLILNQHLNGGMQASPTTGRSMAVPGSHIHAAAEAGLIEGAWTSRDEVFGETHVYVLTEAGRALVGEKPTDHARLIAGSRRHNWWASATFTPKESLAEAFGTVAAPGARAVKALSSELDQAIERLAGRRHDRGAWAVFAAALTHGLARIDAEGRPVRLTATKGEAA